MAGRPSRARSRRVAKASASVGPGAKRSPSPSLAKVCSVVVERNAGSPLLSLSRDARPAMPPGVLLWRSSGGRRYDRVRVSRRDDAAGKPTASRCFSPAGASPASVSAGAPSSRPQARPETAVARAGRRKPLRREQVRGPQHEVKPAASTHLQPESRAAHVTAKATSPAPWSGGARAGGLGGVRGAARGHGEGRNTRGPSARPGSGQRGPHKPRVKAGAAQRESEGAIVPMRAVQQNAAGGKGPCGGHGVDSRTREGMAGETGPNSPGRRTSPAKVRQLQRRLWAAAKRSPERRFHALMDRIWRDDVLREAWRRVKRNRGSAGVDRETLAEIEQRGVEAFLADFRGSSYGFRPKRSATQALEVLRVRGRVGATTCWTPTSATTSAASTERSC